MHATLGEPSGQLHVAWNQSREPMQFFIFFKSRKWRRAADAHTLSFLHGPPLFARERQSKCTFPIEVRVRNITVLVQRSFCQKREGRKSRKSRKTLLVWHTCTRSLECLVHAQPHNICAQLYDQKFSACTYQFLKRVLRGNPFWLVTNDFYELLSN